LHVPAPSPDPFQDTVGAGDSFAAATIGGLMRRLPLADSLAAGVRLASRICGINGATTTDRSLYQEVFR
jgi:fructokinase